MNHERKSVFHFSIIRSTRFELINALAQSLFLSVSLIKFQYNRNFPVKNAPYSMNQSTSSLASSRSPSFHSLVSAILSIMNIWKCGTERKNVDRKYCVGIRITLNQWTWHKISIEKKLSSMIASGESEFRVYIYVDVCTATVPLYRNHSLCLNNMHGLLVKRTNANTVLSLNFDV